jgi:glycosyltransferase involved in cell wall biosynthesis
MKKNLKISIITVAYNSSTTLINTLQSVANQTHPLVEHILVDGGSTDGTSHLVVKYGAHLANYISEPDLGIYDAMNKGLRLATGEVVGFLNSDDFYVDNNVLKVVADIFDENPNIDVLMGGIDFVQAENLENTVRKISASRFKPWMMRFGFMPPHPAVFIKKTAYESIGLFNLDYKIAADFDFLIRLFYKNSLEYKIHSHGFVRMRTGGVSTSGWRSKIIIEKEMLRALRLNEIYSCHLFLISRLPVKFFMEVLPIKILNFFKIW